MPLINSPKTIVKIGRYDLPLKDAVRKFEEPLTLFPIGFGNTVKYRILKNNENPYLLIVSQKKEMIIDTKTGHNTILTVTSRSHKMNSDISQKFQEQTGMIFNIPVPDYMINIFKILNLALPTF